VVLLPRLARALNQPAIAALLGLLLVVVSIVGMATDDISTRLGIVVLVVGVINVIRAIPSHEPSA
jgi:uncharacterized membrane protein HdeD (DUF308 family)